jgi:hypothetical protein
MIGAIANDVSSPLAKPHFLNDFNRVAEFFSAHVTHTAKHPFSQSDEVKTRVLAGNGK